MKKNILIALIALLAVALNGHAQNNTYNMVIEMVNGTKITIGPNDVKNISFNDGELVISGENINTLVEEHQRLWNSIDSLGAYNLKYFDVGMHLMDDLRSLTNNRIDSLAIWDLDHYWMSYVEREAGLQELRNRLNERIDSVDLVSNDRLNGLEDIMNRLFNGILPNNYYTKEEILNLLTNYALKSEYQEEIDKLKEKTQRLANEVLGNGEFYDWGF